MTPCLRPGNIVPGRWFDAEELESFLRALMRARSVKAAWEATGIRMSLDSGYRLYRRLRLCLPVLRTRLCARAPPPTGAGGKSALRQAYEHLRSAFGDDGRICSYQLAFQTPFLAVA